MHRYIFLGYTLGILAVLWSAFSSFSGRILFVKVIAGVTVVVDWDSEMLISSSVWIFRGLRDM